MTIAGGASMILLDEPTAGMSHSETEYAVALIRRVTQRKTLVMVEHDMRVVFNLADTITVLVYGQVVASGPPAEIHPGNRRLRNRPGSQNRILTITRAGFTVRRAGLASISTPGQQASTRRHRGALDKSESG